MIARQAYYFYSGLPHQPYLRSPSQKRMARFDAGTCKSNNLAERYVVAVFIGLELSAKKPFAPPLARSARRFRRRGRSQIAPT